MLLSGFSIVLTIFALIDILTKGDDQVRGLPKIAWVLLVILVPVVGTIVWFAVGHDWSQGSRNHGRYIEPTRHEDRTPASGTPAPPTGTSASPGPSRSSPSSSARSSTGRPRRDCAVPRRPPAKATRPQGS